MPHLFNLTYVKRGTGRTYDISLATEGKIGVAVLIDGTYKFRVSIFYNNKYLDFQLLHNIANLLELLNGNVHAEWASYFLGDDTSDIPPPRPTDPTDRYEF